MPTSPMPNPRDYPDPIGYAVASADWWRAWVHVIDTPREVFSAPAGQTGPGTELEGKATP